jgi:hypothetical protein
VLDFKQRAPVRDLFRPEFLQQTSVRHAQLFGQQVFEL